MPSKVPASSTKSSSRRSISSPRVQQSFRLLEVSRIQPFGESTIDCGQELLSLLLLALLLPQTAQTRGCPQLPGLRLLTAGDGEGLGQTGFGCCVGVRGLRQHQRALQTVDLRLKM